MAQDATANDTALPATVLVVEDDVLLRMFAVEMIEEAGFRVIEAQDADAAIRLLEARNDIRIIFTDIDMPGSMNGLKLAHAVANRWPPIRIIATSGHFRIGESDLPNGGRFIPKPYRQHQVIGALTEFASPGRAFGR
ncbi:response regulator [Tardiphaga sp. 768_D3_N2_1]|uniref:response regulator n=1 Tax=Tardiphaga sp. 768_D3_N2_1 TaxID=3240783 RepID=UPI003F8B77FB